MSRTQPPPGLFYGYVIVIAGFLILTITWVQTGIFGVFLGPVADDFGWTRAITSSAYSISFLLFGLLSVIAGKLTDRFGPRLVVTISGVLLGLGYLIMWRVSNLWQFYLAYALMIGIGSAGSFIPIASTISRWFVKRRSIMTSIGLSGIGASSAISSRAAGWLIASYGWRTTYLVIGIFNLLLVLILAQFLRRDPSKMAQLPYGQNEAQPENAAQTDRGASFQEAFRTPQFWMLCVIFVCLGISLLGVLIHIVVYATDSGIPTTVAPNILAVYGWSFLVGRIILGRVADKLNNRRAVVISIILLSVSLLWLQVGKQLWMLYIFIAIFGAAFGGAGSLISSVVAELFGTRAHGTILGVINFAWTIGGAIGPVLAGYIFDTSRSYFTAFIICAVLSVVALVIGLLLKPTSAEYSSGH